MIKVGLYSQDSTLHTLLSSALGREFQFCLVSDETGINRLLCTNDCDVMILDLNINHDSLQESIECARRMATSQVSCVIMADDRLRPIATELVQQGAYGYCHRPPSIRELRIMLRRAHENSLLKLQVDASAQLRKSMSNCDRMVGTSPQMQHVYHLVRSVANINASVLVTGESGTGKELVARAIHNVGARCGRPFVAVACGAIPEALIEAELFGHEKGAFTGTVGSREGYFEQAGDGTLFLDEIGDLSLYTQVKLLRVLQQHEFCRLGSNRLIPLRARVIFATHKNLAEMVALGTFRHDLYYRINVMGIEVPSLQEHSEDVPQIAMHFLRHYSQMYLKPLQGIEPDAVTILQKYSWPGNVRELENVIQRAIILAKGDVLRVEDVPLNIRGEPIASIGDSPFEQQLHDYKIRLATTAIRENNGNKTLAARSLGISRAYLHRLIRPETNPTLTLMANSDFVQSTLVRGTVLR